SFQVKSLPWTLLRLRPGFSSSHPWFPVETPLPSDRASAVRPSCFYGSPPVLLRLLSLPPYPKARSPWKIFRAGSHRFRLPHTSHEALHCTMRSFVCSVPSEPSLSLPEPMIL